MLNSELLSAGASVFASYPLRGQCVAPSIMCLRKSESEYGDYDPSCLMSPPLPASPAPVIPSAERHCLSPYQYLKGPAPFELGKTYEPLDEEYVIQLQQLEAARQARTAAARPSGICSGTTATGGKEEEKEEDLMPLLTPSSEGSVSPREVQGGKGQGTCKEGVEKMTVGSCGKEAKSGGSGINLTGES